MIYLDHAATSNPKPLAVAEAMLPYLNGDCANPGRASHPLANNAARLIFETRQRLLRFFHAPAQAHAIFTSNITEAINVSLKGLLKSGDQVIVSSMEHNAVMRPLRQLEQQGVVVTVVECDPRSGYLTPYQVEQALTPATRMVVVNHASNSFGGIQPIAAIGELCQQHGCLFLLDSAQTAGCIDIDMAACHVDLLAFTGHKGLLGPMGIGGLLISPKAQQQPWTPLICGGTGSNSQLQYQPTLLPDALESGTPNLPGIAGLNAALNYIEHTGIEQIASHEQKLIRRLIRALSAIDNVRLHGPGADQPRVGVLSFTIDGIDNGELDEWLAYDHQIYCRTGLHCAPIAHQTMGTYPNGTVRLSVGPFTNEQKLEQVIAAIGQIASRACIEPIQSSATATECTYDLN